MGTAVEEGIHNLVEVLNNGGHGGIELLLQTTYFIG